MNEQAQCGSAGAYVVGALSPSERDAFESHLAGCVECRRDVAEVAGLPGLLARVDPDELAASPEPPGTLLPRLLREVRRRNRRRRLTLLAAAAVAAILVGVGAGLALRPGTPDSNGQPFVALVSAPISATATLRADHGGTRIDMICRYAGGSYGDLPAYDLVVTGRDGTLHRVAQWRVGPDGTTRVVGSVDLSPDQIASLEVRTASGRPVLRLRG